MAFDYGICACVLGLVMLVIILIFIYLYVFQYKKTGCRQNGGMRELMRLIMACVSGDNRIIKKTMISNAPSAEFLTILNGMIRNMLKQKEDEPSIMTQEEIDAFLSNVMKELPAEEMIMTAAKFGGLSFDSAEYKPALNKSRIPDPKIEELPVIGYSARSIETLAQHNRAVAGLTPDDEAIRSELIATYVSNKDNLPAIVTQIVDQLKGKDIRIPARIDARMIEAIMNEPAINVIGVPFGSSEAMIQGISRYWINKLARFYVLSSSKNAATIAMTAVDTETEQSAFVRRDLRRFSTLGSGKDVMETLICMFTPEAFIICTCCIRFTCDAVFDEFIAFINGRTDGELPPICDPLNESAFWRDGLPVAEWPEVSKYLKMAPEAVDYYRNTGMEMALYSVKYIPIIDLETLRNKELSVQPAMKTSCLYAVFHPIEETWTSAMFIFDYMTTDMINICIPERMKEFAGIEYYIIHGKMEQGEREENWKNFMKACNTAGRRAFLFTTVTAIRGLNLPKVSHVVRIMHNREPSKPDIEMLFAGRVVRLKHDKELIYLYTENHDKLIEKIKNDAFR